MSKKYSKLPWSKTYRRPPSWLTAKISEFEDRPFVVACTKTITEESIKNGDYSHLCISSVSDFSSNWVQIIPSPNVGRESYSNVTYEEVPDKSGGKVLKKIHGKAPNRDGVTFHATTYMRHVWPRKAILPGLRQIEFRRLSFSDLKTEIVAEFRVKEVFTSANPKSTKSLLACLNLLQENVGKIDVLPISAKESEIIKSASEDIGWTLLDRTEVTTFRDSVLRKLRSKTKSTQQNASRRLDVIQSLNPINIYQGKEGFSGYFAAQITDNLAVFENLEVDHAIYVIRGIGKISESSLELNFKKNTKSLFFESSTPKTGRISFVK